MLTETVFLIVTAVVGGLLVLGAALAAARERAASRLARETLDADWGRYEPDAELAAVEARGSAAASVGVVRVLWWVTIAAVLVGVGLSDAFRDRQATIFGLGGLAVIVVVVLHELIPRSWRNELTSAAEVGIAVALATGLLLLTGYGDSPYVFTLDLLAVAVALARGGWAAFGVAAIASAVYLGVIAVDPSPDRLAGTALLRIALNVGAVWLLAFLAGVFAAHERRVRHMLSDLSRIDPLTRLFNRSQIYPSLEQEVRRTRRSSRGFSVLMIDLDGLKAVNDSLGHQRGDEVLRSLGRTIRNSIRTVDSAYRYGGDEFLVLLPETDFSGAFVVAEKIRSDAEEMGYRLEAEGTSTSVSIGLVSHPEDGGTADELVRAADRAMYNAKSLGKNQISGYPRPPRLAGPPATKPAEEAGREGEPMPEPPSAAPQPELAPSLTHAASAATESPGGGEPVLAADELIATAEEPMPTAPADTASDEPPPAPVEPEPVAAATRQAGTPFTGHWVGPTDARVSLPVGTEHTEEEEPDAAEVRRQIVVASRSFDPDHQIRRAMDAFLSPPGPKQGGRPD